MGLPSKQGFHPHLLAPAQRTFSGEPCYPTGHWGKARPASGAVQPCLRYPGGAGQKRVLLECAGPRFSRAGKDFFREREKAVSGTEWDDLHKAGWANSHDGRSLGRGSRGGRPLLLPTHTWKKGRECRLPPHATRQDPAALWAPPTLPGLLNSLPGKLRMCSKLREPETDKRRQEVWPGQIPSVLPRVVILGGGGNLTQLSMWEHCPDRA